MRLLPAGIGATFLFVACSLVSSADAASLRVAPTTLELVAPDSASVLDLRNDDKTPLNVQVRVFRWSQENGVERLEPTSDVVASPPAVQLQPKTDYVVRVVRVTKAPVKSEESFRVVVDELPDPSRRKAGTVSLIVRHVLPVFFRDADAPAPNVSWSVSRSGKGLILVAHNSGGSRLRIADFTILEGGKRIAGQKGLLGYVLGGATMKWPIAANGHLPGRPATLQATSDSGQFNAPVAISGP